MVWQVWVVDGAVVPIVGVPLQQDAVSVMAVYVWVLFFFFWIWICILWCVQCGIGAVMYVYYILCLGVYGRRKVTTEQQWVFSRIIVGGWSGCSGGVCTLWFLFNLLPHPGSHSHSALSFMQAPVSSRKWSMSWTHFGFEKSCGRLWRQLFTVKCFWCVAVWSVHSMSMCHKSTGWVTMQMMWRLFFILLTLAFI
jgi:hypothetical protein